MSTEVLSKILAWSAGRPLWQRDALRVMLLEKESPSVEEYICHCLAEAGIEQEGLRELTPLEKEHIPGLLQEEQPVRLKAIRDLQNVNALHPKACLEFPDEGLFAIYGGNGSGKTGFGRLLRGTCTCSNAKVKVLGNAYLSENTPPEATIEYLKGDKDCRWQWASDTCQPDLQSVSFFDADCAPVYVKGKKVIAFIPFGIRALRDLADLCKEMKESLVTLRRDPTIVAIPQELKETEKAIWLGSLTGEEKEETIRTILDFGEEKKKRLSQVVRLLAEQNPEEKKAALRAKITRLKQFKTRLMGLQKALGDDTEEKLQNVLNELEGAEQAARLATDKAFQDSKVKGLGSASWRVLWEAAQEFVQFNYPGSEFPAGAEITHCVLCQQELGNQEGPVRNALRSLQEYAKGQAEKKRAETAKVLGEERKHIAALAINDHNDTALFQEIDGSLATLSTNFLNAAGQRAKSIISILDSRVFEKLPNLTPTPVDRFDVIISDLENELLEMSKAGTPEGRDKLIKEHQELKALQLLNSNIENVLRRVQELSYRIRLETAISMANSRPVSVLSRELADAHVTPEANRVFEKRLDELFQGRNLVQFAGEGVDRGNPCYAVTLKDAEQECAVCEIASEGEQRAIALAAFLAELDLSQNKSAVVFDDPVSSLDHYRRQVIANVIASLAKDRQVVVFTHDLYFQAQLLRACKDIDAPVRDIELRARGKSFGHVIEGSPMSLMNFKQRAEQIESQVKRAKEYYDKGENEVGDALACQAGSSMRKLAEHIVEHELFDGVVVRYDEAIHPTNKIISEHRLLNIAKEDLDVVNKLMNEYSKYVHDQSKETVTPPPDLDEILQNLLAVRVWKKSFNKKMN